MTHCGPYGEQQKYHRL